MQETILSSAASPFVTFRVYLLLAAASASLLLPPREAPCLPQRQSGAGCQPPPRERHRLARRGGCLPACPRGCRRSAVASPAARASDSQVFPAAGSPPAGRPDAARGVSWPRRLRPWEYWHQLWRERALSAAPWGLGSCLTQTSPHRADNLTPFHRWNRGHGTASSSKKEQRQGGSQDRNTRFALPRGRRLS